MKTVFQAEIQLQRYLDENGRLLQELPHWLSQTEGTDWLKNCYRQMVLARSFDNKAIALQRTGQLGTYASLLGSEAIDVVSGLLMKPSDVLVPYYRNHACQMLRGIPLSEILLYWGGDERGSASPAAKEDFPNAVPIATQALHACGVASAIKIRQQHRAVVTFCGDGATSKGDFLEALNLSGSWQLPVVFMVNNNQWAISVPRAEQCAAPTLAQKAIGAGIRGVQVDGNDPLALYEQLELALERARQDKGPTLIEAISYRLSDHTTADDATRYRESEELKQAWKREPVKRLQQFLFHQGWWDEAQENATLQWASEQISQAVEAYLNTPPQPVSSLFDYLYAEPHKELIEQNEWAQVRAMEGGTHHEH